MNSSFVTWLLIVLAALFDSYTSFIVKLKFKDLGPIDFSSFSGFFEYMFQFLKSPLLLSAIIAFATAPVLWFIALERIDLSLGYPVLIGLHIIFVLLFSLAFLQEPVKINKLIGCALVLLSFYFFYKD